MIALLKHYYTEYVLSWQHAFNMSSVDISNMVENLSNMLFEN